MRFFKETDFALERIFQRFNFLHLLSFRRKWKNTKYYFGFNSKFRKYWRFNFQVRFSKTLKLAENFGFLHIFQQYKQQSCSFPGSNSYSARIHRFEPVFSLSFTSNFLLGLVQVSHRAQTSPEQDPNRAQTRPVRNAIKQESKPFCVCSRTFFLPLGERQVDDK